MQNVSTADIERISISDLYASSDKITEQLKRSGKLVLTNNDNPVAVMLNVDNTTLEDTLLDLHRLQMQRAIKKIQEASVRSGKSNITLEEINTEIYAARIEKRTRENIG